MKEKLKIIEQENLLGVHALYIGKMANWNNVIEDERILWDPERGALTLAENTPLYVDGRKVIFVDFNKDLYGFCFMSGNHDTRTILELYCRPTFNDKLPSAPKRPQGAVQGHKLSQLEFKKYLQNIRTFVG